MTFKRLDRTAKVILIIHQRLFYRLSDRLEARPMNDGIDFMLSSKITLSSFSFFISI